MVIGEFTAAGRSSFQRGPIKLVCLGKLKKFIWFPGNRPNVKLEQSHLEIPAMSSIFDPDVEKDNHNIPGHDLCAYLNGRDRAPGLLLW